jgi:hypothetical protein
MKLAQSCSSVYKQCLGRIRVNIVSKLPVKAVSWFRVSFKSELDHRVHKMHEAQRLEKCQVSVLLYCVFNELEHIRLRSSPLGVYEPFFGSRAFSWWSFYSPMLLVSERIKLSIADGCEHERLEASP